MNALALFFTMEFFYANGVLYLTVFYYYAIIIKAKVLFSPFWRVFVRGKIENNAKSNKQFWEGKV